MADIPAAAVAHYERMQALAASTVAASRRAWSNVSPDRIAESWREQVRAYVSPIVAASQVTAASDGATYSAMTLADQGDYKVPDVFVDPNAFGGIASDGRDLDTLLDGPAYRAKSAIGSGASTSAALAVGRDALDGLVQTIVADAARGAASVDITSRPTVHYVRMLNPPSCSRCTILAGRVYRWNAGFLRHPACDCRHVATTVADRAEAYANGLADDPYEYFEALSEADQDRVFGKASARSIRDGSDIYRVENAKRGAQPGRMYTTEGTGNQRGTFRSYASDLRGQRLTPDAIYAQASTREEALDLLDRNGYLFRGADGRPIQVSGGRVVGADYEGFGQAGRGGTRASDGLTAAARRLETSRLRYEAALAGRNPYGRGTATPAVKARAEKDYRRWLATNGEIYTQ